MCHIKSRNAMTSTPMRSRNLDNITLVRSSGVVGCGLEFAQF